METFFGGQLKLKAGFEKKYGEGFLPVKEPVEETLELDAALAQLNAVLLSNEELKRKVE